MPAQHWCNAQLGSRRKVYQIGKMGYIVNDLQIQNELRKTHVKRQSLGKSISQSNDSSTAEETVDSPVAWQKWPITRAGCLIGFALPKLGQSLLAKCWCTSCRVCAWLETYPDWRLWRKLVPRWHRNNNARCKTQYWFVIKIPFFPSCYILKLMDMSQKSYSI